MPVGVSEAVAAIELIQYAHKQGWFEKLIDALKTKHRVLVLGSTGTGKTNLLDSLTEAIPKAIDLMSRTEFVDERVVRIEKAPFVFVDTPGQLGHESRRRGAILKAIRTGVAGVVNVVSYSYHESRVYGADEALKNGRPDPDFLERQRQEEIRQLSEWTELLGGRETTGWMVTVVTKADLWWSQRAQVMKFYESGEYKKALAPARALNPVVLEYSSVFQKFYGAGSMSGDFQDGDRVRAKSHLLRELLTAIGKKGSR